MFTMKKSYTLGFTLIELLVVISIIGLLVGVSLFALTNSFQASRDSTRKSDLKQYQTALENYANKNNSLYFSVAGNYDPSGNSTLCTAFSQTACPDDPIAATRAYYYQTNGTGLGTATATQYALWATLEEPASPVTYWVVCSNGKSGNSTTAPAGSGVCPLP